MDPLRLRGAMLGGLVGTAHVAAGLYASGLLAIVSAAALLVPRGAPGGVLALGAAAAFSDVGLGLWLFPLTAVALRDVAPGLRASVALVASVAWVIAEIAPAAAAADPAWAVGLRLTNGVAALAALAQVAVAPAMSNAAARAATVPTLPPAAPEATATSEDPEG